MGSVENVMPTHLAVGAYALHATCGVLQVAGRKNYWAGDDVNCCSTCLPGKYADRAQVVMVLRDIDMDANVLRRIFCFVG